MRSKEDIQKEIDALESTLSERKKELEDYSLRPYDWGYGDRVHVDGEGDVFSMGGEDALFSFDDHYIAERFANKLRVLSLINNLKKSLGCDYEFTNGEFGQYISYDFYHRRWLSLFNSSIEVGMIHFRRKEDAQKVCEYLNEYHPKGWVG